jgi:primosomal protein N' (replication factor Y)
VAVDVEPGTEIARLRPLRKVVGAGPTAELVALADWAAWRWAGPPVAFLRVASPPNVVPTSGSNGSAPGGSGTDGGVTLHVWPPAAPRSDLVTGLLAKTGSTIVVLADSGRTPALVRALEGSGHRVVVLRADRPDAERTRAWAAARAGGCVVVGGRAAMWAPVPDLAAVIVLDEGDEALEEERAPTWHAREVAIERARRREARVELVSPAPTVDALVAASATSTPPRVFERDGWPHVLVVDRREDPPGTGLLSPALATALHHALDAGGRAVCVLNRKGRARLLACVTCGELARCEGCGAAVAESPDGDLVCPRDGTTRPKVCLHCHATRMKAVRPGVSRLRDDLAALLPRAGVAEVDASTGTVPEVDVLVGTEAVLHRVPRAPDRPVLLVAFCDFDQELLAPRVRAAEQAMWLLVRAARLTGHRAGPGRVLVQTRVPGHEVVEAARRGDPTVAAAVERARRAELGYPPYGAVAEVSGAADAVDALAGALAAEPGLTVSGPVEQGSGRRALARAASTEVLADALARTVAAARARGRLRVDVDPGRA